jgi:hypothetical protein
VTGYKSQAARDAQAFGFGDESYWECLDESAQRHHDYDVAHGEPDSDAFTRTLSDALRGNDGI